MSLLVKERLYIGEATVASLAGLILGPHCLDWFDPLSWGNSDKLTLEICRIVLCIQIVAVAVELPRKYMKKHWLSVAILLVPVMTIGWLVVGLFIWVLIPHFNFSSALLVAACVTATDPVLAAAVVGKGKFAERVPGHLRNLLTAESGCNDGMAFPFIFLSLYILVHPGDARDVAKDWFTLTILWECFFGVILGVFLGYVLRKALEFAEKKALIDRESFLALFVFLAFMSAGLGSILGVDDLLVSFAAGTAFGWNGSFAKKTDESHVSTVIDLLLNLSFFVYFGAIVPWDDFNNPDLGLNVWRLIVLAIVIIFLRRVPAVLAFKPFTPDIKTWREALFCGHFGPIGVGAIFAAILARMQLEEHYTTEEVPLADLSDVHFPHYQLIKAIWPIICFVVITSILVHGSSVAVLALGKRLNRMAITMSFTTTNTQDQGPSWMSRLQKLEHTSTSYSLHRIDSSGAEMTSKNEAQLPQSNTIETSGIKVRPAGGARRKRQRRKNKAQRAEHESAEPGHERHRPQTEFLQLGRTEAAKEDDSSNETSTSPEVHEKISGHNAPREEDTSPEDTERMIYEEGDHIIIEDEHGEIIDSMTSDVGDDGEHSQNSEDNVSYHSMESLRRHMTEYSVLSSKNSAESTGEQPSTGEQLAHSVSGRKTIVRKDKNGKGKKYYAHQVDDKLFIEDEDGDIIRRYKLNRHSAKSRSRSGSIMGKALSAVGIKKADKMRGDSVVEQVVQPPPVTPRQPTTLEETSEDSLSEENDADLPEETEVERQRRLAALGHIRDGRRDDDEEA